MGLSTSSLRFCSSHSNSFLVTSRGSGEDDLDHESAEGDRDCWSAEEGESAGGNWLAAGEAGGDRLAAGGAGGDKLAAGDAGEGDRLADKVGWLKVEIYLHAVVLTSLSLIDLDDLRLEEAEG